MRTAVDVTRPGFFTDLSRLLTIPGAAITSIDRSQAVADTIVYVGDNSPEFVAYRLMRRIMSVEDRTSSNLTRKEILDTYRECLRAVRSPHDPPP